MYSRIYYTVNRIDIWKTIGAQHNGWKKHVCSCFIDFEQARRFDRKEKYFEMMPEQLTAYLNKKRRRKRWNPYLNLHAAASANGSIHKYKGEMY